MVIYCLRNQTDILLKILERAKCNFVYKERKKKVKGKESRKKNIFIGYINMRTCMYKNCFETLIWRRIELFFSFIRFNDYTPRTHYTPLSCCSFRHVINRD